MPKTPMHKDHFSSRTEGKIRAARKVAPMEAVSVAERVDEPAHEHFGLCSARADQTHAL